MLKMNLAFDELYALRFTQKYIGTLFEKKNAKYINKMCIKERKYLVNKLDLK